MNRYDRVLLVTAFSTLLPGGLTLAQDKGADSEDLKKEVQALRSEVAELKATLGEIDKQIKSVLTEVQAVKKGQAAAPAQQKRDPIVCKDVKTDNSPYKGPKEAPITVTVFSEFQCPYCSREAPVLEEVLKAYPNDVKVVFKHYPLGFHAKAKPASAATILAFKQKGVEAFWQMHDLIFADPKKLEVADLRAHAEKVGLDLTAFDTLMANPADMDALVKADMDEATRCKVTGTPTVLIDGVQLTDRNLNGYKTKIDEILAQKKKAS